ncbi:MAG: hypothetical protein V3V10_09430, partial [Planctomycetota bacterium]
MKILKEHLEHTCEAHDKGRYALNGVIFTPYGTVSTDGRRLHETPHCHDAWADGDCSAVYGIHDASGKTRYSREPIFPVRDPLAKAFVRLCKPITRHEQGFLYISYDESDGYFHLESPHGAKMKIPSLEGVYPDYESVMPLRGKGGVKLCFDADYLRKMATAFQKTGGTNVEHQGIVIESRYSDMRAIDKHLDSLSELFADKDKHKAGKKTMQTTREQIDWLNKSVDKLRGSNDDGAILEQNGHYALLMPIDGDTPNGGVMTDKKRSNANDKMLLACGLKQKSRDTAKKDVAKKRAARKKAAEKKPSSTIKDITAKMEAAAIKSAARMKKLDEEEAAKVEHHEASTLGHVVEMDPDEVLAGIINDS